MHTCCLYLLILLIKVIIFAFFKYVFENRNEDIKIIECCCYFVLGISDFAANSDFLISTSKISALHFNLVPMAVFSRFDIKKDHIQKEKKNPKDEVALHLLFLRFYVLICHFFRKLFCRLPVRLFIFSLFILLNFQSC